jgi:diguanylate cyclase (GGDEF)-like protein
MGEAGVKSSPLVGPAAALALASVPVVGPLVVPSVLTSRLGLSAYFIVATAILLILLSEREARLRRTSTIDAATGLGNRAAYNDRVVQEVACAVRCGKPLSLLVVDLDHLKEINDGHGHEAGDRALRAVAETLRRTCRSTDLAARWGGDELVVLAPSTTAREALALAGRIRTTLARLTPAVTVSIGVADLQAARSRRPQDLFDAADRALYRAKACGRDKVVAAPGSEGPLRREACHEDFSNPCAG